MNTVTSNAFSGSRIAVSAILERRQGQRGRWSFREWRLVGMVAGQAASGQAPECTLIHSDEHCRRYLWSGLSLVLYRDAAESYWYNLVGKNPSLYLICGARADHELAPLLVSANYDEAAAHMETDSKVFSAPLPPQVYRWLESYVMDNYVPREPERRRRENWVKDGH
jgi:hypothetical protein